MLAAQDSGPAAAVRSSSFPGRTRGLKSFSRVSAAIRWQALQRHPWLRPPVATCSLARATGAQPEPEAGTCPQIHRPQSFRPPSQGASPPQASAPAATRIPTAQLGTARHARDGGQLLVFSYLPSCKQKSASQEPPGARAETAEAPHHPGVLHDSELRLAPAEMHRACSGQERCSAPREAGGKKGSSHVPRGSEGTEPGAWKLLLLGQQDEPAICLGGRPYALQRLRHHKEQPNLRFPKAAAREVRQAHPLERPSVQS